jgi:hypothetical protein
MYRSNLAAINYSDSSASALQLLLTICKIIFSFYFKKDAAISENGLPF